MASAGVALQQLLLTIGLLSSLSLVDGADHGKQGRWVRPVRHRGT